ncbi:MAG: riboflavin biosynthesis protein RibF [Candidatus Omnitrophota bacterium]
MKIIYGVNNILKFNKPVVAMGVFDGVHRGHRAILKAAVKKARRIGGVSMALTFWPHPQKEGMLYSLEHRLRLIAAMGIDACVVINFSRHFAGIKAEDFLKDILADKIKAAYVYVGRDFRFGCRARGDLALLQRAGERYGFKARGLDIMKAGGTAISSTLIRGLIRKGELKKAKRLLQGPVSILGTVVKGTRLGRIMGFPTANINPHHEVIPAEGIYAVRIILGRKTFAGACYIGTRPTISAERRKKINVEVHIFGFHKNIYGRYLEIRFVKKIRPDKKFPSLTLLAEQVRKDVRRAREILVKHPKM